MGFMYYVYSVGMAPPVTYMCNALMVHVGMPAPAAEVAMLVQCLMAGCKTYVVQDLFHGALEAWQCERVFCTEVENSAICVPGDVIYVQSIIYIILLRDSDWAVSPNRLLQGD